MTPEEFTKHVGAPSFEEAVDVTLRTKAQDEEKIEGMFSQVKELFAALTEARAKLVEETQQRESARAAFNVVEKERNEAEVERDELKSKLAEAERKNAEHVSALQDAANDFNRQERRITSLTTALAAADWLAEQAYQFHLGHLTPAQEKELGRKLAEQHIRAQQPQGEGKV